MLGVDCGRRKTGVAIGQTLTQTAQPLDVIHKPLSRLTANDFADYIAQWQPKAVVLGMPYLADDKVHPLQKDIERLAIDFAQTARLPTYFMDEYLSSHEAKQHGGNRQTIDDIAAAIILQTWLAESSNNS